MYRGTIPAAWADQGPVHEVTREPAGPQQSGGVRRRDDLKAKRPRGACAARGEIIALPHFCGAPRRSRSYRPSPGWFCSRGRGDRCSLALEAIENIGDTSGGPVPSSPRDAARAPPDYSIPMRENPATGQSGRKVAMSCSRLSEILSGFYNSARPLPRKGCVRNLPLSGRYCDPRDGSVVGGDVLRWIHR